MKKLLATLFILFAMMGCTLPPLAFEDDATSQSVNHTLLCAEEIDVYPISINGVKAPQASFDLYIEKLKKYTTPNVVVHNTLELTIEDKSRVNEFIQKYGNGGGDRTTPIYLLSSADTVKFIDFVKESESKKSAIVMIYTPELLCKFNNERHLRGYAFDHSDQTNIVAYNATTINNAPVISDTQAWKIVLTHEVGHRLGVPANRDHNKAGHCTSRECIMYAKPDWQAVVSVLFHGMPYDFCDKCKAELEDGKKNCTIYSDPAVEHPVWKQK
jgi:predicted Zn-dependent protease